MSTESNVTVRFSAKDTELVKAALADLGESGQKLLDKLAAAGETPTASIKALNTAVEEGKGKFNELASQLGAFGAVLSAIGPVGLGVAASLAAIGESAKSSFEALAQQAERVAVLKEVSERIGLTTEALQEMRFAATESGIESDRLDSSLARFGRNVGEAVENTGSLADIMREYGINVVNADKSTRGMQEVLADYADAIKNASSPQEQLRLAIAAFGKEGASMVNILLDGSHGLDEMAKKAKDAGVVLDQGLVDSAKRLNDELKKIEQIKAAEAAKVLLGDADDAEAGIQRLERGAAAWARIGAHLESLWNKVGIGIDHIIYAATAPLDDLTGNQLPSDLPGYKGIDTSALGTINVKGVPFNEKLPPSRRNLTPGEVDQMVVSLQKEAATADQVAQAYGRLQDGLITINALRADGYKNTQLLGDAETALTAAYGEAVLKVMETTSKTLEHNGALFAQVDANNQLIAAMVKGDYEYDVTAEKLKILKSGFEGSEAAARAMAEKIVQQQYSIRDYRQAIADAAEAQRKAAEQAQRAAEEQARAIQKFAQDAGAHVVDSFINMLDGSKKPFDALLKYAEQTFAKIAAEAILNPIIVPIVTAAAGSLGSFGAGGSAAAGAAGAAGGGYSSLGLGAGQLALTGSLGTSLANSINVFGANTLGLGTGSTPLSAFGANSLSASQIGSTSLTGVLGGAGLGFLGGGLWSAVTGGNKTVSELAGTAAGALAMIPGGQPFAIAIAALGALGSLFGPGPTNATEGYQFNPLTGENTQVGNAPGSAKYSQQNLSNASNFMSTISNFTKGIASATGGTYTGGNIGFDTGNRDGSHLYFYGAGGGGQTQFDNPQDALSYAMQRITTLFTGIPADVETAFKSIDWTGDLQTNLGLVQFAATFQQNIKAMESGTLDIQKNAYTAAEAQVSSYIDQIQKFKATTAQLGLSTADADAATKAFVENLVGLKDTAGPQSPLDQAIETIKGTFAAIGPLMVEVGDGAVDMTDLLNKAIAKARAPYIQDVQSRIFASTGRGYLNSVNQAEWQYATDAGNVGSDLAGQALIGSLKTLFAGLSPDQLQDVITTFSAFPDVVKLATAALDGMNKSVTATLTVAVPTLLKQAAADQMAAVNQQISAATSLQTFFRNAQSTLKNAAFGLDFNSATSVLNPMDQLNILQAQFSSDSTLARLGNQSAISGLDTEGTQLVTLAKQVYGSTDKFVAIQQQVKQTFNDVADIAGRQADIAQSQLDVLNKQLTELTAIANAAAFGGSSVKGFTGTDLDALNASFSGEYNRIVGSGSMSESDFVHGQEFALYQRTLLNEIGGLNDPNRLRNDLPGQEARFTDPLYGSSAQQIAEAMAARLVQLLAPNDQALQDMVSHLGDLNGNVSSLTDQITNILARLPRAA